MLNKVPIFIFLVTFLEAKLPEEGVEGEVERLAGLHTDRLSEQIRALLEHYKQHDPVGIPGLNVPDPMPIPDMRKFVFGGTYTFKNSNVYGLSQFRIEEIDSNIAEMKVRAALSYSKLEVRGNYTFSTLLSRSGGAFQVNISDVYFEGAATLGISRTGNLEATNIDLDIAVDSVSMEFQNRNILGNIFQGVVNTLGTFIFDSIKPFMLREVNTNMKNQINTNLKLLKQTFPNSIPPLDLAIAEGRKFVREEGYDPYKIDDYYQDHTSGFLSISITDIWVSGLATFYRVGNVTASLKDNILQLGLHMSTNKLEGKCKWEVSVGHFLSRAGSTSFTADYLQIETRLNQSLDVRQKPRLDEIQLKIGNIQLRMSGTGTVDYILEFLANILPNLLRYQIVNVLEYILAERVQDMLNSLDIEKEIESHLSKIDDMTNPNRTIETETFLDPPTNAIDFDQLYEDIHT